MRLDEDWPRSGFHQQVDASESRNTSRGVRISCQVGFGSKKSWLENLSATTPGGTRVQIIFSDDTQLATSCGL